MAHVEDVRDKGMKLELGGKERIIKFDLNAYAELELKYGTIQKAMEVLQSGSVVAVRTLLWAGLIHDEVVLDEETGEPIKYTLSQYQVGKWIDPVNMKEISDKLGKAIEKAMPPEAIQKAKDMAGNQGKNV